MLCRRLCGSKSASNSVSALCGLTLVLRSSTVSCVSLMVQGMGFHMISPLCQTRIVFAATLQDLPFLGRNVPPRKKLPLAEALSPSTVPSCRSNVLNQCVYVCCQLGLLRKGWLTSRSYLKLCHACQFIFDE